jgi:transitional endoplasmic reticulum ATPase
VSAPSITLVARLAASAADSRRGVVRLHPEVLDALGLRSWDAVTLTGARVTTALVAAGNGPHGQATLDDVTLSNAGLSDGAPVVVAPAAVEPARLVRLTGSQLARASLTPETVRLALLGKVVTGGDAVSLLPQDIEPAPGLDAPATRQRVAGALGAAWTSELLTVATVEPAGAVAVRPSTVVGWEVGAVTGSVTPAPAAAVRQAAAPVEPTAPPVPVEELVGNTDAARRLVEWLELTFDRPDLLRRLGGSAKLGVLVVGPEGVGKLTLVRSTAAAVDARCVELAGPGAAALEPGAASERVHEALRLARQGARTGTRTVLVITDVEALLPSAEPPPLATLVIDVLRDAVTTPGLALVATTSAPESVDPRLRGPDLVDRELGLTLPDVRTRTELLRRLLSAVPMADGVDLRAVAERTPGFVVADLAAVRREAAVQAALRHTGAGDPTVGQQDLLDAVGSVRPISMSSSATLRTGGITLDQVGDMVETKQALTEAVLWPLQYPDSFARLGVSAPRGVLVYGPPGCGKTFLLRALAGTGQLNVIAVKGAELLDKYVGESERAVRELFPARVRRRAVAGVPRRDRRAGATARAVVGLGGGRPRRGRPAHRARRGAAAARRDRRRGHQPARADRPRAPASRTARAPGLRAAAGRRRAGGDPAGGRAEHPARRRRRPRRARRRAGRLLRRRLRRRAPGGRAHRDARVPRRRRGDRRPHRGGPQGGTGVAGSGPVGGAGGLRRAALRLSARPGAQPRFW